ncbi:DUF3857 and transglutaminase domain-containing protein [Ramlibacter sp. WS9]|uniref:DUF3857 domain-containing transglutaminase family protein n=1 Tax=Ramlibacter sp. WS9 TaxID=1882741 RepID=UPI001142DD19|nr:DUF3857 and transglutaminase domain-containing protein [Ramlibacter sp. WS9]ROZ78734.1 DUF3857 domain-containing protein [Ramlibacter sp. WS9]
MIRGFDRLLQRARQAARLLALGSAVLLPLGAWCAPDYLRGPAPRWVAPQALDVEAQAPLGQTTNGMHYLLVDQQVQLDPQGRTNFKRLAIRALNQRGVEIVGRIGIDFDPSYETLTLHSLSVHRDGRVQDRMASTQARVLQRETELENQIYDGSRTVDLTLDDVRPGDVVEYAFSIRGGNPVFGGRSFGRMDMQWRAPVHRLHRRLLVPEGQAMQFRSHLTALQARTRNAGGWVEHVWEAAGVPPMARQDDVPGWYDPYPAIQWSAFADWAAVARWAEPLYAVHPNAAAALRPEIDRIAGSAATPEQRLLAVLDFVQSQIRYLGIEMGPGSHAPRPPDKVLERRYGDCKDKVLLAVTMLRALGVTAHPALVHTRLRGTIDNRLPSPGAFNHVIFKAKVDGRELWFDPTRFPQKGRLDSIPQADFGRALLLDGDATALSAMPATTGGLRQRHVAFHIDASAGFDTTATVTVTSTFDGLAAERMRDTLRNTNLDDLQRNYLNYYLRSYSKLSQAKPLDFADDDAANRLVTTEHYQAASLLGKESGTGKPVVYFDVPDMKAMLGRPDDTLRSAPLGIAHPEDVSVDLTARLPRKWTIETSSSEVKDAAFHYSEASSYDGKTLKLSYRYRSLADHVPPAGLAGYVANLEKARRTVGYTLWPHAAPANPWTERPPLAWSLGMLLVVLLVTAVALWWQKRARKAAPAA